MEVIEGVPYCQHESVGSEERQFKVFSSYFPGVGDVLKLVLLQLIAPVEMTSLDYHKGPVNCQFPHESWQT